MPHFWPDMAFVSDYLHTATNLRAVVPGSAGNWHSVVRGIDPESGSEVGVAGYQCTHERKAEASKCARDLLRHVKAMRR